MPFTIKTEEGRISVSEEVIAVIAGSAALDCYGLVGMASRHQFKDGIAEMLGRDNLSRGVEVRQNADSLQVNLYVIVGYGTKISEVAHNIQQKVKYIMDDIVGIRVDLVNIIIQGVRVKP